MSGGLPLEHGEPSRAGRQSGSPHRPRLRDEQQASAWVVAELLRESGTAVLADPVGSGKTFTAIGAARLVGGQATVVCPAHLVPMWRETLERFGEPWSVVSDGVLSRRPVEADCRGVVIVDEAHRFRNRSTRRRRHLAELVGFRPLLLVTATPTWRDRRDLVSLLGLGLGDRDFVRVCGLPSWDAAGIATGSAFDALREAYVVARGWRLGGAVRRHALWTAPAPPEDRVEAVSAGARAAMVFGGEPSDLFASLVLRRWASSAEAAVETLGNAARFIDRLDEAARAGRTLGRAEWRSAFGLGVGAEQQVLPFWFRESDAPVSRATLERARDGVASAIGALSSESIVGSAKLEQLRRVIERNGRVMVCTEYVSTAFAIGGAMPEHYFAVVASASRAHWYGVGALDREQVTRLISDPESSAGPVPRVIVITPFASEGLNLQRAADTLVHYDLPWTEGRLEQRVGRLDRIGGPRVVTVHTFAPPAVFGPAMSGCASVRGSGGDVTGAGRQGPTVQSAGRLRDSLMERVGLESNRAAAVVACRTRGEAVVGVAVLGGPGRSWARQRDGGGWNACPVAAVAEEEARWRIARGGAAHRAAAALAEIDATNELRLLTRFAPARPEAVDRACRLEQANRPDDAVEVLEQLAAARWGECRRAAIRAGVSPDRARASATPLTSTANDVVVIMAPVGVSRETPDERRRRNVDP